MLGQKIFEDFAMASSAENFEEESSAFNKVDKLLTTLSYQPNKTRQVLNLQNASSLMWQPKFLERIGYRHRIDNLSIDLQDRYAAASTTNKKDCLYQANFTTLSLQ